MLKKQKNRFEFFRFLMDYSNFLNVKNIKLKHIFSATLLVFSANFSTNAQASTWGCEVLLCLANPAGPMAVAACVPPITKLYQAIFKPKPDPFPSCEEANDTSKGGKGGNYAAVEYNDYYDPCPAGTSVLAEGTHAVQGTLEQIQQEQQQRYPWNNSVFASFSTGIGEGSYSNLNRGPSAENVPDNKVCVGNLLGNTVVTTGTSRENRQSFNVAVYDRLIYIDPVMNGFAVKVWQNNTLTRVIRPKF